MRKMDLAELALRSLNEDISLNERALIESELINDHSFGYDFRDRVLMAIEKKGLYSLFDYDFSRVYIKLFNRIAVTGLIAIIVLIVSIFVSQGSISYDALLGIDSSIDEGLLSLLIE